MKSLLDPKQEDAALFASNKKHAAEMAAVSPADTWPGCTCRSTCCMVTRTR